MPRTITIPSNLIDFSRSFDASGNWIEDRQVNCDKPHWECAIIMVGSINVAGFSIGIVPAGFSHRQVCQGPLIPGPWGYISARASVLDTNGGTRAEIDRARQEGRVFDAEIGDTVEIDGNHYRIDPPGKYADRTHIRLTLIESPAAVA